MNRPFSAKVAMFLVVLMASTGCQPIQPFFYREDGDLSHYLERATEISHPDVYEASLPEVEHAMEPLTISNVDFTEFVDYGVEDIVHIALQNSKVIRNLGGVTQFGFSDALIGRTGNNTTIYDPALVETDPQSGVEAALSAFDAELAITNPLGGSLLAKTDRPRNVTTGFGGFPTLLRQDTGGLRTELRKRTATGAIFSAINETEYDRGNSNGTFQALRSTWETSFQLQVRQPLLRGRGTQVNRVPIVVSRINTDITLANFEASIRNLLLDIENTYWDLACSYRILEATKTIRDSAHRAWQSEYVRARIGAEAIIVEAPAREQYYFFQSQTEQALRDLLNNENRMRFLMGLAPTDGRVIRPIDKPTTAPVEFDWHEVHGESLVRSAELRQQKWAIKRRELELVAARNQLLPQFDITANYSWYGIGDHLTSADPTGVRFANRGSTAYEELISGDFQEYRVQMEFLTRVGMRRELATVRNAQLALVREKARLEDMELNQSHLLTAALRNLDANFTLANTNLDRWIAADQELEARQTLIDKGAARFDLTMLDVQRRWFQALTDYLRTLCEYNKSLAEVHFRKGSLLEYNNVTLAEGPWPQKAYWDATERARERDAGHYMDYGWTRPKVVSQGPVVQQEGTSTGAEGGPSAEEIRTPSGEPTPAAPESGEPQREAEPKTGPVAGGNSSLVPAAFEAEVGKGVKAPPVDAFDWGPVGSLLNRELDTLRKVEQK